MKEINLCMLNYSELIKRVAIVGPITDCMQLRLVRLDKKDQSVYTTFECGIDILTTDTGKHIIISNLGFYGLTFDEFVKTYSRFSNPLVRDGGIGLIICDDSQALHPYEDEDEYTLNEIKDDKLVQDIPVFKTSDEAREYIINANL